jgi:hypothetical protein
VGVYLLNVVRSTSKFVNPDLKNSHVCYWYGTYLDWIEAKHHLYCRLIKESVVVIAKKSLENSTGRY